jgi:hypothetical protein
MSYVGIAVRHDRVRPPDNNSLADLGRRAAHLHLLVAPRSWPGPAQFLNAH